MTNEISSPQTPESPVRARPPAAAARPYGRAPVDRLLVHFRAFAAFEASGGIVLLGCTLLALAWANSPWRESYHAIWHITIAVHVGGFTLSNTLVHWINDALMTVFFFVVGLEIKRELLVGELASPRRAALPIAAAVGGMIVPAGIYALLNAGTPGEAGWGVPMATDITFALGAMALLGRRAPLGLKVFVTAFAVVDDIGAVLVIALFYTAHESLPHLAAAAGLIGVLIMLNRLDVRHPIPYGLVGVALWLAVLQSGVHATIAGVLLAMTIPARERIDAAGFLERSRALLDECALAIGTSGRPVLDDDAQALVQELESTCEQVQTPLQRLEHSLQGWVTFFIMPVFAIANAGVTVVGGEVGAAFAERVTLGVLLGLVLGKQIGITLFTWLAVRLRLAALPAGVSWLQVYGAGWLGGIGFTMSLFVAQLAFGETPALSLAKIGILSASLVAGLAGVTLLRWIDVSPAAGRLLAGSRAGEVEVTVPAKTPVSATDGRFVR